MSKFSRLLGTLGASVLAASALVACGSSEDTADVYFLNFKPEQDAAYQAIAKKYTEETGVPVKVVTAASGTYEQTLKSEVAKSDAPTLFQINGPVGLQTWQSYAADITDLDATKALNADIDPLKGEDGKIYGLPFAVEGYGIIYNEEIFDNYFALPGAPVGSLNEVDSFTELKAVAEDMQSKADELGINGVFASTSLASGEDWRWQTHLANLPVHQEFVDLGDNRPAELEFKYNAEFKNLFDLYLDNSTVPRTLTPSKAVSDSMAEFALGQAAMVQNGNWAWSQISDVNGNVVKKDKIKYLPMYMGLPNEASQGLAIGTENYLAVNAKASELDQQASRDFVNWLFTTDEGRALVVSDLGFIAPFDGFTVADTPDDPLAKEIAANMTDSTKTAIPWDFQYFPSQQFKNDFGQALAQYATGNLDWNQVVETFRDSWAAEQAALK
ncbi:carbohydrate ABC transporter substrate-binding protein [Corynebacterium testudinoris]|uniref:ABC-type sugar transport system, periplasmic component n=1 Tax=Corynebacterium testudinoris TaxID=136857 RepID=A0A0G3HEE7_9CORY|nr:ABC transporter substrate-binding protein [Corynebacterium testudinoris]AKK09547.1 ABC-type sugar transport system, periplasmic component [Corynebacterium testudinoris]MBX8996208.1 carbohydrate ABC transporter substrate-binding protein [Corynebacterium testudinoris]